MKIYFLSSEDPEWDIAWSAFHDKTMMNGGEYLQYMGTVPTTGAYVHEFRHRMMPGTNQRQLWRIPCTPGWQPRHKAMESHLQRLGA